jgi:cell division protein FtsQ
MSLLPWKKDTAKAKAEPRRRKRPQASRQQPAQPLFQWRPPRWVGATLGLMLLLGSIIWYLPKEQWLPIDRIRLIGRFEHIDKAALQRQLQPYLGQGFFTVDIKGLRRRVESLHWVRESRIRRVWPNSLQLRVIERSPVARFDERRLIDRDGDLFEADVSEFQELPLVRGYAADSREVLRHFTRVRPRFVALGLDIRAWIEDDKGSLKLRFGNDMELRLGSRDRDEKIEQFLAVYPMYIAPQQERISAIDFRYSNGFAVAWKKPKETRDPQGLNQSNNSRDKRNV